MIIQIITHLKVDLLSIKFIDAVTFYLNDEDWLLFINMLVNTDLWQYL
jgi:hypothetical protein